MKLIDAEKLVNSFDDAVRDVYDGPLYLVHMAEGKRKQLRVQLIAALCEDKWIPVSEGLLEDDQEVVVWVPKTSEVFGAWFYSIDTGPWFLSAGRYLAPGDVTHWQPLPEGPEGKDEAKPYLTSPKTVV